MNLRFASKLMTVTLIGALLACGGGGGGSQTSPTGGSTPAITVTASTSQVSLAPSGTVQLHATVSGSSNTGLTWTTTGGLIDGSGLYTAPAAEGTYRVVATSVADPAKSATITITVTAAPTVSVSVNPTTANMSPNGSQTFTAVVSGSANTAVTWSATAGSITSGGVYTAPATAGTITVTATSVADPTKKASAAVTVTAPAPTVSVTVNPTSATLSTNGTQTFTAKVTGSANTAVTWSATGGSITSGGVYTAPATVGTTTVTATSVADPTKKASATVTVTAPAPGAAFSVKFTRTSSWSGGYNADITLTNTGTQAITTWTLVFTTADTVTSSWNANQATSGHTTTFTPLSWNGNLAPGASATIGLGADTTASGGWAPPATATVNGQTVTVTTQIGSGSGGTATPTVGLTGYDQTGAPAMSVLVPQGTTLIPLTASGQANPAFKVEVNNGRAVKATIVGGTGLQIQSNDVNGGRAGLRITETTSGSVRYVGVRVKDVAGATPGFPKYVSMGVVSEDADADLDMFNSFGTGDKNRYVDNRYIYLNGGPINGWWNWSNVPGERARKYVRESLKMGAIPTFVWYNIPDGGESYTTDLEHIQSRAYMKAYFELLRDTLAIFNEEAKDETIMMVMEPDFLGYMMQLSGKTPDQIQAFASAAKDAGLWTAADPTYPDTLPGLVSTINHILKRDAPQVRFGWQFNVWASLDGSVNAPNAPKSLMKVTDGDQQGWTNGRKTIYDNAVRIAAFYKAAGVTTEGAHFISFDKYGLDAVGVSGSAATDPAGSTWFWNADHWNNYLYFVKTLHDQTNLPVALWQLPVGRINHSQAVNPYAGNGTFADLDNTTNKYEDSTASYFFGDVFVPGSAARTGYFATNASTDPGTVNTSGTLTWGAHIQAAKDAGVFNLMFGDGVGMSTRARPITKGQPAPDGWWLMTAIQRYLVHPILLP